MNKITIKTKTPHIIVTNLHWLSKTTTTCVSRTTVLWNRRWETDPKNGSRVRDDSTLLQLTTRSKNNQNGVWLIHTHSQNRIFDGEGGWFITCYLYYPFYPDHLHNNINYAQIFEPLRILFVIIMRPRKNMI